MEVRNVEDVISGIGFPGTKRSIEICRFHPLNSPTDEEKCDETKTG